MKYYKRLLSLVLVCVLLFGVFSTQVNASSDILDNTFVRVSICDKNYGYCYKTPPYSTDLSSASKSSVSINSFISSEYDNFYILFEFMNTDGITLDNDPWDYVDSNPLFKKGSSFTIGIYDIIVNSKFGSSPYYYLKSVIDNMRLEVFGQNGEQHSYYFSADSGNFSFTDTRISLTDFTATDLPFDVYKYRVVIPCSFDMFHDYNTSPSLNAYSLADLFYTDTTGNWAFSSLNIGIGLAYNTVIRLDTEDTDTGLLRGIITWLKEIKNKITDVFNSISELPTKLWTAIENGLKALFVPSTDYFSTYSERWDSLLSDRFGAIYQVGGKLVEFAQTLLSSSKISAIDSLQFPTWNFEIGGTVFTFGGWQVPIRYEKFDFLYTASKMAFGIAGTFLFMQGLRKRYDEVMGVEQ